MSDKFTIMAIDPAYACTGVIVAAKTRGVDKPVILAEHVFTTEKSSHKRGVRDADDNIERCRAWLDGLAAIVREYELDMVAAELPPGGAKSNKAATALARAGALLAAGIRETGLPAEYFTPSQVKLALTGHKQASKDDMELAAVKAFPELAERWKGANVNGLKGEFEHVADAVGVLMACLGGNLVRILERRT